MFGVSVAENRRGQDEPLREFAFSHADFENVAREIYRRTGIFLDETKKNLVYARIGRRLRALSLMSFAQYREYYIGEGGQAEIQQFVNSLTTNHTGFFREPHHFDHFVEHVVRPYEKRIRERPRAKLRVWSAACASGEEPYTIAMSLALKLANVANPDVRVLATDVNTEVLDRGRRGVYRNEDINNIPVAFRDLWTQLPEGKGIQATDEIAKLTAFRQLNLLAEWPMKFPFDAIFCRNVMIYFDNETRKALLERMHGLLREGGWLYIGHSETLCGMTGLYESAGATTYRKLG